MDPKILKNDKEYEQGLAQVDALMSAAPGLERDDQLALWVLLVRCYEDQHYPIEPPDPITAIKFRMEQQGLKQTDLVPYMGSKSKVSEVLSGRRSLSLSMIRKLHEGLEIPLEVLIRNKPTSHAKSKKAPAQRRAQTHQ